MRRKRLLALGALLVAASLAGCGFGSSDIPEDQLTENASYEWNTSADATFNVSRSSYTVVVNVSDESMEVWQRDAIEGEQPVQIEALQFRYPNGTIVDASHDNLSATVEDDRTIIETPTDDGKVAYTAPRSGKQFGTPTITNGSYEVVLPPGARVGIPLLSQVSPGNWNSSVEDNRMTVRWGNLTKEESTINVRYYLQRDLWLFGGLALLALVIGGGGALYYLRQIRTLEAKRDELDIDIDYDDDEFDDGPPPGM